MENPIFQATVVELYGGFSKLLTKLATLDGSYCGFPRLPELVETFVARNLNDLDVPNRIGADMLGISLSTYHRRRRALPQMRVSVLEEVLETLRQEGPIAREPLLTATHYLPESDVRLALHHLERMGLIVIKNEMFHVLDFKHDITRIDEAIAQYACLKRSRMAIVAYLAIDPKIVQQRIDALIEEGTLVSREDGFVQLGEVRTYPKIASMVGRHMMSRVISRTVFTAFVDRLNAIENGKAEGSETILYFNVPGSQHARYREIQDEFKTQVETLLAGSPDNETHFEIAVCVTDVRSDSQDI